MPSDGRRKLILQGVVAKIKTATGASYFYDYSTGVVTLLKEPIEERLSSTLPVQIRVYDGEESTETIDFKNAKSEFAVRIKCTVRARKEVLVDAVQDVLADLSLVLGDPNWSPGGPSTTLRPAGVEAPTYNFNNTDAVFEKIMRAEYEFVPGTDT